MKRGRKSAAELSVIVPFEGARRTIEPPAGMSEAEAKLFREVIASVPPTHFAPCDVPLLSTFVGAPALNRASLRELNRKGGGSMLTTWERSARMVTMLATKLRLTPQSRNHPITTARRIANFEPSGSGAIENWLDDTEGDE